MKKEDNDVALPHQESGFAFLKKHTLCRSLLRFQPASHCAPISPRHEAELRTAAEAARPFWKLG